MENAEEIKRIKRNYTKICKEVANAADKQYRNPGEITIVAVSKTFPPETIEAGILAGIRSFGENYAQELRDKLKYFAGKPYQIDWHFIGHLQANKVKYLIPFTKLIHSIDSIEVADEVNKRVEKYNIKQNILMQVNTSGEASKSGCEPEMALELAKSIIKFNNLNLIGLMTIGSLSGDEKLIRGEFSLLRNLKDEINKKLGTHQLTELSMGMSGDYKIAIEEGSTILRIGTAIFGQRTKHI
ncbi:MAG TPA: YggS family pyridoxal phosphate-dependent enzyme [Candidatus Kapabacteria bacterium]|jgi:pyridoxal phosphate enzyme (YggS family)|nr:YggS family pyridoxal phosphate-dependent enzyme [Candidatus Kapabacteria bacterium]HOV93195.1 YggS family pyridoxal phosphate-dependent enzyme [Candidatus Kapabacteria bacterium]